jgi:hypothetical protein
MQALLTKFLWLEKNFYSTLQKIENAKSNIFGLFFSSQKPHFTTGLFVSHVSSSSPTPSKILKCCSCDNQNNFECNNDSIWYTWVIMVAVAHSFENFYKITKNNILPTNFKNLKKFQISKMEFSDILLKLFPSSYMLLYGSI